MSVPMRKIVNRAAVRGAFRRHGARVPHGFMEELEQVVYRAIRGAGSEEPGPTSPPAVDAGVSYLKRSVFLKAVRQALGKRRVDGAIFERCHAAAAAKVEQTAFRKGGSVGILRGLPSGALRAFLRSPESEKMTITAFFRRWQDEEFRAAWVARCKVGR